jgi:hypothetical protein
MAHTHGSKVVSSAGAYHVHLLAGGVAKSCSVGLPTHTHPIYSGNADGHTHNVTFDLASADLGSPWWNHVHGVNKTIGIGNGVHNSHSFTITEARGCSYFDPDCYDDPHTHAISGVVEGNGGTLHDHTVTSVVCATADPAGTPEAHTHLVTMTLVAADGHTHTVTCTVGNTACHFGNSHNHTPSGTTGSTTHPHSFGGISSSGGESLPVTTKRLICDGFILADFV